MTAPELKPCPFCGASASYDVTSDEGQQNEYDTVGCSACPAEMRIILHWADDDGKNKADLLSAWNRRADLAAVQPAHGVWNKCTFDLSGAGYDCVLKDGDARHGAYGEGQKVFWDGTTINAEGLYILSKPALDKRIAAAQPAHVHPDPRDEVIARLVDALKRYKSGARRVPFNLALSSDAALAAAKAVVK